MAVTFKAAKTRKLNIETKKNSNKQQHLYKYTYIYINTETRDVCACIYCSRTPILITVFNVNISMCYRLRVAS